MTTGFDNPQTPSIVSETYIPDQLIAGRYPLVTGQNVTLTGGALLPRGSVLGQITEGVVATAAGVQASGSITLTGVPAVNDTLTLAGTAITFIANGAVPVGNQVAVGTTAAATALALVAFLQASTDTNITKMTYAAAGTVITATAVLGGTSGNALTLAKSSAAITLSGATLTGGVSNTGNGTFGTITRGVQFKLGNYKLTMTAATVGTLVDPSGDVVGTVNTGVAFVDPQISFTLTAGGTAFVAGDSFVIAAAPGSGKYQLSVASATDGSQVPIAILGDQTDASAGDVNCAAYFTGEFNGNALNFDASWNLASLAAPLRDVSIFIRNVVSAAPPH